MTVIISYRRDDTGAITGRICDRLRAQFGAEAIYMDIDSNPLGVDYRSHIDESLKNCDILLAVIGRHWLGGGEIGLRRIDDPTDLVRLEVTSALARGIRVVPLLIDDTEMPSAEELPEDLKGLKFRQAFRVDSGVDFHHHLDRLCAAIETASPRTAEPTSSLQRSPTPAATTRKQGRSQDTGSSSRALGSVPLPLRENEKRLSGLALAALICSVVGPFLGYFVVLGTHLGIRVFTCWLVGLSGGAITCGHLARKQIRRNPSLSGNGLAITGLILGYVVLLFALVVVIAMIHETMFKK